MPSLGSCDHSIWIDRGGGGCCGKLGLAGWQLAGFGTLIVVRFEPTLCSVQFA